MDTHITEGKNTNKYTTDLSDRTLSASSHIILKKPKLDQEKHYLLSFKKCYNDSSNRIFHHEITSISCVFTKQLYNIILCSCGKDKKKIETSKIHSHICSTQSIGQKCSFFTDHHL